MLLWLCGVFKGIDEDLFIFDDIITTCFSCPVMGVGFRFSGNMSKTINLERFKAIIGVVVNGGSLSLSPSLSPLSISLSLSLSLSFSLYLFLSPPSLSLSFSLSLPLSIYRSFSLISVSLFSLSPPLSPISARLFSLSLVPLSISFLSPPLSLSPLSLSLSLSPPLYLFLSPPPLSLSLSLAALEHSGPTKVVKAGNSRMRRGGKVSDVHLYSSSVFERLGTTETVLHACESSTDAHK